MNRDGHFFVDVLIMKKGAFITPSIKALTEKQVLRSPGGSECKSPPSAFASGEAGAPARHEKCSIISQDHRKRINYFLDFSIE